MMKSASLAIAIAVCVLAGTALAKTMSEKLKEELKPIYNKPIYYPETKSYFELSYPGLGLDPREAPDFGWEGAKDFASTRSFKGVRGRLAVVKSKETSEFLVKTFRWHQGAWIGLRFLCGPRILQWVTGEVWPLEAYSNWGPIWNVGGSYPWYTNRAKCTGQGSKLNGVHYWSKDGNFKWNANGQNKAFPMMLIEYPTGKP